ncbi:hypothetical protein QCA50_008429 [Cerrena zonata]|uniref:non-specific serine/threonine protein kinase n=1 Tax=Cerrena zonata TaxID=2478898 RepID=A0AAW0GD60_9APHY
MAGSSNANASRTLSWYSQLPRDTASSHHNALGDVFYQHLNSSSISQRRSKSTPALSPPSTSTPKHEHPYPGNNISSNSNQSNNSTQSRLQTERSFEIEQVTDIREIDPEWDDEDIDEIIVISPKKRRVKALSIIPEDPEASKKFEKIDATYFQTLRLISSTQTHKVFLCKKLESAKVLTMKVIPTGQRGLSASVHSLAKEQSMLKYITQLGLPLVQRLQYSFQDNNALYLATDAYVCTLVDRLPLKPDDIKIYTCRNCRGSLGSTRCNAKHNDTLNNNKPFLGDRARYSSPELILGWGHDRSVDIWSMGVTFYMMLSGKHPFLDNSDTHWSIIQSKILYGSVHIESAEDNSGIYSLIHQCLERNPVLRSSIEDLKVHSYFSDLDWATVRACSAPGPIIPSQDGSSINGNIHEDLYTVTQNMLVSDSHIDGFSFTLEPPDPADIGRAREPLAQISEASPANSNEHSATSLPSSFLCTSFGEIKEHRTFNTFDNSQDQSTDDLGRRNTVAYFPNSLVSMSTPERTPTRGLRKYASLDFELDTIVSLTHDGPDSDDEDGEDSRLPIGSRSTPLSYLPRWSPLKGFRFNKPLVASSPLANSPYQNLTPDFAEDTDIHAGSKKLRKKPRTPRSNSTASLLPSSYAEPLRDLPSGIQQIGSGIGFTFTRSPKIKNQNPTTGDGSDTPRRSMSLLPNGSRYQALLSDGFTALPRRLLRATKRSQTLEKATVGTGLGLPDGQEDDEEMEAVMKEVYGSNYSLNFGGDSPPASPTRPTAGPSSDRDRSTGLGFGLKASSPSTKTKFPSFITSALRPNSRPLTSPSMEDVIAAGSTLRLVPTRVEEDRFEFEF